MIEQKIIGSGPLCILKVAEGFMHKKGTDIYAKSIVMLPADTLDMYEEVDEIPLYTKAAYDAKVNELVRERYSESEEFAIQRKMINVTVSSTPLAMNDAADTIISEYAAYNTFVEECKEKARAAILEDIERRKAEEEAMSVTENTGDNEEDPELV